MCCGCVALLWVVVEMAARFEEPITPYGWAEPRWVMPMATSPRPHGMTP